MKSGRSNQIKSFSFFSFWELRSRKIHESFSMLVSPRTCQSTARPTRSPFSSHVLDKLPIQDTVAPPLVDLSGLARRKVQGDFFFIISFLYSLLYYKVYLMTVKLTTSCRSKISFLQKLHFILLSDIIIKIF